MEFPEWVGYTQREWQHTPLDIAQLKGHKNVVDFLSGRSATQAKSKKSSKSQKNSAMELDGYLASLGLGSKKGARKKGASGGASTGLYLVKNSAITGGGK